MDNQIDIEVLEECHRADGGLDEKLNPTVRQIDGRLHLTIPDPDADEAGPQQQAIPVTVRYLRPLSAQSEIAFLDEEMSELLILSSVNELSSDCQALVRAALADHYHMPEITRVESIVIRHGSYYVSANTDKGSCWFAIGDPGKNIRQLQSQRFIVRDTAGNRYEIKRLDLLDLRSQRLLLRSLIPSS